MLVAASAWAGDGDLDPGFGHGGVVLLPQITQPRAAIAQADGTLLVGGSDPSAGGAGTYVRLTAAGTLAGRRASGGFEIDAFARAPGGTVVAALTGADAEVGSVVAVTRLEPDLTPDPGFNHGRPARLAFPNGARATAVAVAPDGSIVVGAVTGTSRDETARGLGSFALARFLPAGGLDIGFGDHGVAVTPFRAPTRGVTALAFQADGKILAAGPVGEPTSDFGIARYSADGALDRSWSDGTVVTDLGADDRPLAVSEAAGGTVAIAGSSGEGLGVAHYTAAGALDRSFSGDGVTTAGFGGGGAVLDAAFLADGRILAAGASGGKLAVARYDHGGGPDGSFGSGGLALVDAGDGPSLARQLVVLDGGDIVAAGDATASGSARTVLARLRGSVPAQGTGTGTPSVTPAAACNAFGRWDPRRHGYADAFSFSGTGWRPGATTTEAGPTGAKRAFRQVTVRPDGTFSTTLPAPLNIAAYAAGLARHPAVWGRRSRIRLAIPLTVRDVADPQRRASVVVHYVHSSVLFRLRAHVGARVKLRAAGFEPGAPVYLHAYRAGRLQRSALLGRAVGACGTLVVRRRLLPAGAVPGGWVLSFGTEKRARRRYVPGGAGERFARRVVVRRAAGRLVIATGTSSSVTAGGLRTPTRVSASWHPQG